MEAIRQYLLSVTAAAILCGIVTCLLGKEGTLAAIGKLLAGLFLAVTVISPWAKLQLIDFAAYTDGLSADASEAVQTGKTMALDASAAIIKSRTEAYILDKAASLEVALEVDVTISDSDPPVPCAVCLKGDVSPYAKQQLACIIEDELGIAKEDQTWTG